MKVEAWNRTSRPPATLAIQCDDHRRPAGRLYEFRGDDPDHPGMPLFPGHNHRRAAFFLLPEYHLRLGFDFPLDPAPLGVDRSEFGGDLGCPFLRIGHEKFNPGIGPVHATGRVDPGTEPEPEILGREP